MKSEPDAYSIDDLARERSGMWEGVRNYQARNNLRAMKVGDLAFFYHSNANPPGIAGLCRVVKEAYPDHTAFDPGHKYFDPKSDPDKPRWFMPDVEFVRKFDRLIPLPELRETPGLEQMQLLNRSRLSVQSVSEDEWNIIRAIAEAS